VVLTRGCRAWLSRRAGTKDGILHHGLNVGRMNNDVQQETQRIDQDVPFATFDLLARVVA
jgi:hypothetical protein